MQSGIIAAVCISEKKGTPKRPIPSARLAACHGLEGDAHAGNWHRQVSLLSLEKIRAFEARGAKVQFGDFGENIVASGIDFRALPVGTVLQAGAASLVITQIGKECHKRCAIFDAVGDCIMPREGVFAVVTSGGCVQPGDTIVVVGSDEVKESDKPENTAAPRLDYTAAIITLSDKGFKGGREDEAGKTAAEIALQAGFAVSHKALLPDEQPLLEAELVRIADNELADLILTTGGTGLSPRDTTPEATLAVAHRLVPGIAEAMRAAGLSYTKRAMLSRAVCAVRKNTLIVNLPGSPRAVRENLSFIIEELKHALGILSGRESECARVSDV